MFAKVGQTWELMRACWEVLKREKGLILFPLFSGISCLLVIATFAMPILMTQDFSGSSTSSFGDGSRIHNRHELMAHLSATHYIVLFMFYWCNYFVITFFNTAIIHCAVQSLQGKDTNVGEGFRGALSRIHLIAGWALLSATVGVILRIIEDKSDWVGRLVAGLFGIAWTVASYLVVPILVVENKGPIDALKESALLLRKTWGERLVGGFSFGAIFGLLMIPAVVLFVIGIVVSQGSGPVIFAFAGLAAVYAVLLSLVQSTLSAIFQAAVYLYAKDKTLLQTSAAGRAFPVQLLQGAMRTK